MLLKSKICFTVLTIYEIVAVSAMHFQRICDAMFPTAFCDSWFRYFLFCVVVPLLVFLIVMWIREIVRFHRRRSFIRRARNTVNGILNTIRGKVSEHINMQDMEKIITAAILVGIKKYADHHPNLRRNVNHVIDIANGDAEIDVMATVDEVKPVQRRKTTKTRKK
jgi:sensor domain CHASE-containing protein